MIESDDNQNLVRSRPRRWDASRLWSSRIPTQSRPQSSRIPTRSSQILAMPSIFLTVLGWCLDVEKKSRYRADGASEPLGFRHWDIAYSVHSGSMVKESNGTGMRCGWDRSSRAHTNSQDITIKRESYIMLDASPCTSMCAHEGGTRVARSTIHAHNKKIYWKKSNQN